MAYRAYRTYSHIAFCLLGYWLYSLCPASSFPAALITALGHTRCLPKGDISVFASSTAITLLSDRV